MGIDHIRFFARRMACAAALVAGLAGAAPAAAEMPTDCQSPFFSGGVICRVDPITAEVGEDALGNLGSTGSPEDDLLRAIEDLGAASDDATAAAARGRALAILSGDDAHLAIGDKTFLAGKAYHGIPLLNTKAKVQDDLPAGATVDIQEVRFGDHALLDTSMLRFTPEAMGQPFTIRWFVTELGTSFGGELSPAAVPKGAGAGALELAQPLVAGALDAGTKAINRFHPVGAGEETRLVTQFVTLQMPPPAQIGAILDPNLKPGHETFAQIAVGSTADPEPVAPTPSAVAGGAPERMLWDDLTAMAPTASAAHTLAAEDAQLVGQMRSRDTLPSAQDVVASADVDLQIANGEAYLSRRELRVAPDTKPDGTVRVAVTNLDDTPEPRQVAIRELHHRAQAFGVLDWGNFQTDVLETVEVPAGATKIVTVTPDPSAYSLWLGDPAGGDQAGMAVALDRGPRTQSLSFGEGGLLPLHQVLDRFGDVWVTMEGNDEIKRLHPAADKLHAGAGAGAPDSFPLPGGIAANPPPEGTPAEPVLGPGDIAVDGHGIIWATLVTGNAIARIDPTAAVPGTTKGIKILKLAPCDATCRKPPPPLTPAPLSRFPLQMRVMGDGAGNTVVFFTEQNADRIGALRVSRDGDVLNEQHFNCACAQPLGIALDADGAVWFSEGTSNRLGKLTLDQTRPFAGDTIHLDHFKIPNPVEEFVPGEPKCTPPPNQLLCADGLLPNPALTALPHSVSVDRRGRVWYTGEANERIGYLDPAKATQNTSDGFVDAPGPENEFGRALAPADIAIDRAGRAYFTDEYGDQIAAATVDGTGAIHAERALRPEARNSLTDSPMIDDQGNLWYIEGGANLITRVAGVTAGLPRPGAAPVLTANTATGHLTASGLREMTTADVRLLRGSTEVTRRTGVKVLGGGFEVTLALKPDDRIQIVPGGSANPPAAFTFRVANLTATVTGTGTVQGTATNGGRPLADSVTVDAGGGARTARIDISEGTYALPGSLNAATVKGTVSWTAGSPSATFETITPFGPASAGGGGQAGGGSPAGGGAPTPASGGGAAPAVPSIPATPAGTTRPATPAGGTDAACQTSRWLTRRGSGARARRTLPLLGLSLDDARRCLGRPAKTSRRGSTERWTYSRKLELRLSGGRVVAFTLLGRSLRSTPDRAAVGTSVTSFRRALGTLARSGRGYRALVALGRDGFADVRLSVSHSRVSKVTVTVRRKAQLDAAARRLLRSTR